MRLIRHLCDMPHKLLAAGSAVTIGAYDGLHLGHQALLATLATRAREQGLVSVVMSFEPTPKEFFQVDSPPARLMRFREKYDALAVSGVDMFYCPRFSPAMRQISSADFIRRVLVQGLNARELIVGDDFRFARKREGDVDQLRAAGEALGYAVDQVSSVTVGGMRVSSTAIRSACEAGDMQRATLLLGRPYRMSGRIVKGARVGRKLGFPTANVDLRRRQSPLMGVYAVRVGGLPGGLRDGVASVGARPTFGGTKALLEVFLFDFDEDIYGQQIQVDFIAHLRGQEKYDEVEELVAQMHLDADNARSILAANPA